MVYLDRFPVFIFFLFPFQAIFNLGFLVEQGSYVPEFIWNNLKIPKDAQSNNMTLLLEVYGK